ncbi:MAG: FtsQ-type POTRA domain-containing protein [bacterium]|nr:FtsQ-type POTRA domain-containing protein [bacterium]
MRRQMRFKRKKKRVSFLKRRYFWYALGFLFLSSFLFWTVVFSPWLEIQEVRVEGTNELSNERVLFTIREAWWKPWLGIPTNSILLFDAKYMEEKLLSAFPLISSISVERSLPKTLGVNIQEREQKATWCPPAGEAGKEDLCLAIDEKGVPYKKVTDEGNYAVFHSDGSPQLGQELLDPSLLSLLLNFKEKFQAAGELARFSTVAFDIAAGGEIQAKTQEGFKIFLDTKEDMDWQEAKLRLVLEQKVPPERREELEYIDLRFGSQAYLKYQD